MTATAATTSGTVPLDGGHLWFETAGSGPDVVLAHPGMADSRIWDEIVPDLARDHRVTRYDARGHGRSSSTAGDHHPGADLLAVLDHAGIDRAVLVGNSLGGVAATDVAVGHPDRVAGLVLVGSGLSGYDFRHPDGLGWQADVAAAGATALATQDAGPLLETILRGEVDGPHRTPADVDAGVRERLGAIILDTLMAHYDNQGEFLGSGAAQRLPELAMPVLVLVGELDFQDVREIADLVADRAPTVRKVVLDGIGHMVQNEAPQRFLAELRTFLAAAA